MIKISRLLTTIIVISLMTVITVILAKFQALLFQSGIGLKIVNLSSNKHRADNKGDIATVEFSEFNLGGISERYRTY